MIKYTKSTVANRPTYRTVRYGNLLSDTYQGEIYQSDDGNWAGWFINYSNSSRSIFKFGCKSKLCAVRWVNNKSREIGVS